jgi:hypothetical protein
MPQACPTGTTTLATAATSQEACHVTLAGYQAILDNEQRVIGAVPCLVGTFSPEGADVCYPCPSGLTTQVCACKHSLLQLVFFFGILGAETSRLASLCVLPLFNWPHHTAVFLQAASAAVCVFVEFT